MRSSTARPVAGLRRPLPVSPRKVHSKPPFVLRADRLTSMVLILVLGWQVPLFDDSEDHVKVVLPGTPTNPVPLLSLKSQSSAPPVPVTGTVCLSDCVEGEEEGEGDGLRQGLILTCALLSTGSHPPDPTRDDARVPAERAAVHAFGLPSHRPPRDATRHGSACAPTTIATAGVPPCCHPRLEKGAGPNAVGSAHASRGDESIPLARVRGI